MLLRLSAFVLALGLSADSLLADPPAASQPAPPPGMVELKLQLPKPAFPGTPKAIPPGTTVEKPTGKPRAPYYVPPGTVNLALKKPVTSSDSNPVIGKLELITDGNKEHMEGNWVELGPSTQWVQIDLKEKAALHCLLVWHYHGEARVYRDVVVQVCDDPDFITDVKTIYNNDQDNSSGLGIGKDPEYFEFAEGRLIPANGVVGRYVRLHSRGSTSDDQNQYTEVEIYGQPAK